jgi:hypothetical protein
MCFYKNKDEPYINNQNYVDEGDGKYHIEYFANNCFSPINNGMKIIPYEAIDFGN